MRGKSPVRPVLALLALLFLLLCALPAGAASEPADILYFYDNPCAACDLEGEFYELFNCQVGDLKAETAPTFRLYNVFSFGWEEYEAACERLGIPEQERNPPLLVIRDRYLMGEDRITQGLRETYCAAYSLPYVPLEESACAPTPPDAAPDAATEAPPAVTPRIGAPYLLYYYTVSCDDCRRAAQTLDMLAERFPDAIIDRRKLTDGNNVPEIQQRFAQFSVPAGERAVPILFYEGGYLGGAAAIEREAAALLESGGADYRGFAEGFAPAAAPLSPERLPFLLLAGLINGLNPCAISMVLLLVSVLLMEKRHLLSLGLTYVAAKGVTYFAIAFGLYTALSLLESRLFGAVSRVVQVAAALLMLAIAALSLWDFFACRREDYGRIRLQLPGNVRAFLSRTIERLREPRTRKYLYAAVAAVSVVVSAGEFLCTGQIALATLIYMVQSSGAVDARSTAALALYVLAMLAAPTALIVVLHRGQRVLTMSEWVRRKMPLIKLLGALVFIAFALAMLLNL